MFIVIPAIDILNGKCVRLTKGDYGQSTIYNESPVAMAKAWEKAGAKRIHVVDLDGAKTGSPVNKEIILSIARECTCPIELGGGIRSMHTIDTYINAGVAHIILGSVIFKEPALLKNAVKKYGDKIIAGIDLMNGQVKVSGWMEGTNKDGITTLQEMVKIGVTTAIITDIAKDGALSGTSLPLYRDISSQVPIDIIASGGVTSLDDIRELKKIPHVIGCIIGKALYEKTIDLTEALKLQE